jgi:uncharacterized membrane-anchored protein
MKPSRKTFLITSVLITLTLLGFIFIVRGTVRFQGLDLLIFAMIVVFGVIAFTNALKKDKEEQQGFPADDEFSNLIKYKSGYLAFLVSMYMWLFIFLLQDKFPDTETMLGGGILLSGLISVFTRIYVKRQLNAQHD